MRKLISILTLTIITGGFLLLPNFVSAQSLGAQYDSIQEHGIIFANICTGTKETACACRDTGSCTLDDILQVAVNIGVLILAISGSVFLLIMVYGGMTWILSRGSPQMVEKGKNAMAAALIGLAIIFGAYAAITLVIKVISTESSELDLSDETLEEVLDSDSIETTTE